MTTTLANALKAGRISHAYLLSGPRGTGKTSIARILAHEINGLAYDDEAHLDIIEIDAASNRRIDEIRDLRDRVNIAPSAAKYKVYIIDEVHMLTKEAFNALLKTLEEPPAHVVFILATTEAHKLPETIISRTQRYSLRPVPAVQVIAHLKTIAKGEKLQIDDDALQVIAEHGEGSFRDSISLLDQASSTSEHVTKADVERILGLAPDEYIIRLHRAIEQGSSADIVSMLGKLYGLGYEPAMVSHQLSIRLRAAVVDGNSTDPQASLSLLQKLLDVPAARSPKQLLEIVLLQATLQNTSSPILAAGASPAVEPDGRASISRLDSTSVDMPEKKRAQLTETPPATNAPDKSNGMSKQTQNQVHSSTDAPVGRHDDAESTESTPEDHPLIDVIPSKVEESSRSNGETEEDLSISLRSSRDDRNESTTPSGTVDSSELWQQALDEIKKQYNTLYGIARMAKPEFDGQRLTLVFKFAFHQKRMNEAKNRKIFGDVMEQLSGAPIEIVCVVAEGADISKSSGSHISTISNIFGGAELLE